MVEACNFLLEKLAQTRWQHELPDAGNVRPIISSLNHLTKNVPKFIKKLWHVVLYNVF